jgi:hypothetical protein
VPFISRWSDITQLHNKGVCYPQSDKPETRDSTLLTGDLKVSKKGLFATSISFERCHMMGCQLFINHVNGMMCPIDPATHIATFTSFLSAAKAHKMDMKKSQEPTLQAKGAPF